jgi:hypothetical protein
VATLTPRVGGNFGANRRSLAPAADRSAAVPPAKPIPATKAKPKPTKKDDDLDFLFDGSDSDGEPKNVTRRGSMDSLPKPNPKRLKQSTLARAEELELQAAKKENDLLKTIDRMPYEEKSQRVLNKYRRN